VDNKTGSTACLQAEVKYTTHSSDWSILNRIDGVMISVLASNAVDRGFEPRSSQPKDYNKDWLSRNQANVPEWGDMSTRGQRQ